MVAMEWERLPLLPDVFTVGNRFALGIVTAGGKYSLFFPKYLRNNSLSRAAPADTSAILCVELNKVCICVCVCGVCGVCVCGVCEDCYVFCGHGHVKFCAQ